MPGFSTSGVQRFQEVMKMNSREEVLEILNEILRIETATAEKYTDYMTKLKNPELIHDYIFIRDQEVEHMEIARKMIELAEK